MKVSAANTIHTSAPPGENLTQSKPTSAEVDLFGLGTYERRTNFNTNIVNILDKTLIIIIIIIISFRFQIWLLVLAGGRSRIMSYVIDDFGCWNSVLVHST